MSAERQAGLAVVTGGGRGIGAAICETLTAQGWRVARLELDPPDALASDPLCLRCDVGDPEAVDAAFARVETEAPVLALVNNAGYGGPFVTLSEVDDAHYRQVMRTNVDGTFHCMRRAIPAMKAAGFGRIVNIASVQGLRGAALSGPYVASKHAVVGLTRSAALELGDAGITVNAVCPGYVDTAMGLPNAATQEAVYERAAIPRQAHPSEVAALVGWLLSADAAFVTGAAWPIDGGLSAS